MGRTAALLSAARRAASITVKETKINYGQADQELISILKNTQILNHITRNPLVRGLRAKNKDHRAKIEFPRFLCLVFL